MRANSAVLPLFLAVCACGLPKDPDDTLHRVHGGTLRVGVAVHPPWTTDSAGGFGGVEPALVRDLARELGARVEWRPGGESVLMPMLHERKLDLVIAGLDASTPWSKSVGVSRSYQTVHDPEKRELVWAVAPGENAWQMEVERFLRRQRSRVEAMKPQLRSASTR
jgi:polar amino acid transport system substrate-binding protein